VLSRIAESLFWIGRYLERADSTARIVDVHVQRLLEDAWLDEAEACRALLTVMGVPGAEVTAADPGLDRVRLMELLGYDAASPSSIAAALGAARENARRVRETVSSELWESLNTTFYGLTGRVKAGSANRFCTWVRERVATVTGIADTTMSRDAGYWFLSLGRSLERADMTARLLSTTALAVGPTWQTMLRSCGAYEAFLRTYSGGRSGARSDAQAAEFLLLDRLFPRSVVYALSTAEGCLAELSPDQRRAGYGDEALRLLTRTRTQLEFRSPAELLAGLAEEMSRVQEACSEVSQAVSARYFPAVATVSWTAEA
jgi:uncharacterized alpha-E superfamily protein